MILELLVSYRSNYQYFIWNILLIGGPNQSHKVSFKELLSFLGKDDHSNIFELLGQLLFRIFRRKFSQPLTLDDLNGLKELPVSPSTEAAEPTGGQTVKKAETGSRVFFALGAF